MDNIEAFVRAIRTVNPEQKFVPFASVQDQYALLKGKDYEALETDQTTSP